MQLSDRWQLARTPPGLARLPAELPDALDWIPAPVPGTAAAALRRAGRWDGVSPLELNREDVWYRAPVALRGPHRLRFEGLATLAEVWLDGERVLEADSMFRPAELDATLRGGSIHIRFRALFETLRRGRPRWRPRMVAPPGLRAARTTLLGHMPGWCPPIQAVGPWRPVTALPLDGAPRLAGATLAAELRPDGAGSLSVALDWTAPPPPLALRVAGQRAPIPAPGGTVHLPEIAPWWPHTHGEPRLHPVELEVGNETLALDRVGFRRLECDRGADGRGFGLRVNGEPVFCRGANWIAADLAALPSDAAALRPWLEAARDAGMNMLRLPGVGLYEADAFYRLCDELGLLVWQDAPFANFDYPDDPGFLAGAEAEVEAFLRRTRARACLAVLCGGSEVAQQAAMLGLPASAQPHPLFDAAIPSAAARTRPGLVYVPHSPGGGALPFAVNEGVSHYYGVGAYLRPVEDARRAAPRFVTECLAFANVPEPRLGLDPDGPPTWNTHDPRWKRGTPRDAGAAWDFEDVRDHYLQRLFGADPARLRYEDPERYLDLSRATVAELVEACFAEWRRPGSPCRGALVWTLHDLAPGAGWGVLDWRNRPKSAWHALRRACRPIHLGITDEGLDGLGLHMGNETADPIPAVLRLACLDRNGAVVAAQRGIVLPPRGALDLRSAEILESFFDITYAYRFGPPAHDVTVASLLHASDASDDRPGTPLAEAFHFPRGHALPKDEIGLRAEPERDARGWVLALSCERFAQSVHVRDRSLSPSDSWFHMAPGRVYRVRLHGPADAPPEGEAAALNAHAPVRYRHAAA